MNLPSSFTSSCLSLLFGTLLSPLRQTKKNWWCYDVKFGDYYLLHNKLRESTLRVYDGFFLIMRK
jgi:hypothetical protein